MIDFSEKIDYSILEKDGVSIGETLKLITPEFTAYLFVMGFDDSGIPIVEYNQVKYIKDIDWENSRYGAGDAFEDGDVMPYVYSNFSSLPNMGLIHPEDIQDLPTIDPNNMPEGLYDIS